ncbi:Cadmium resistance transporter [Trichormus variabilis ATCC 29413]|uniref:Cadmium resistance transporter n=2 Tax=Anabaena variabilis TaxID=264691 RepID=Q3M314_TRIV2|nr:MULTISPECIES: cadmium resistance transporter [Nostocaceae]ABA24622.1 Cadmium resistance transporter [Trichormus variabilis ATCC 29413]MBC1213469.1 cadmium resistance transporter [Trichormus variabilis ARAD]MBC1266490.1 cadmium resistance transporter [Trichormus variabilis FSR]MBC1301960.1 cadmium resistance transporter [Trichormus variabilis N2B]MBC1310684.1 cadmium resistance transporter [Trichormus variabilis PNB]
MSDLITTFLVAISAFVATNIDDVIILLILFSQVNSIFRCRHIVAGQYLGFIVLIIASLPGLFGGLIIPPNWIGLLGLIPMAMGISSLVNGEENETLEMVNFTTEYQDTNTNNLFNSQTYKVAAITIANGSDNISVYIPLFASSNVVNFIIIIGVFFILIAIWCYAAYKFTYQTKIANILSQYSNYILPFALIILGGIIILKTESLTLVKLVASCICLAILVKKQPTSN